MKLPTIDIPQSDSLDLVRCVVSEIAEGHSTVKDISDRTGFSVRHVRYRLEAARILGLLDEMLRITDRGRRLLTTIPQSREERTVFRRAVQASSVVRVLTESGVLTHLVEIEALAKTINELTGLSIETSMRRARTLRSWFRQIDHKW
jgi:hypothetical protein